MADNPTPQVGDSQDLFGKAREILNRLPVHRLNPSRIKVIETEPRAKGGQATITIGTIIPPEADATRVPEQLPIKLPVQQYAIKRLEWDRADVEKSAKFFKSFVNELRIMATLSHPNIVQISGFVEDIHNGDAWLVLRWEANGNVREFLRSGEWDIPERISIIQDVVDGVEYLHARAPPICHGDLKSLNILVNSSYHAVVTDFGSARTQRCVDGAKSDTIAEAPRRAVNHDAAEGLTAPKIKFTGTTLELTLTGPISTLRWTAPEVLAEATPNTHSDMWAVGWICWEIMTGKLPFEELPGPQIIYRVITGKLPAVRDDAQVSQIVSLCSLMSDCWITTPVKRIDAFTLQRKVAFMPFTVPSNCLTGDTKVRSAALLNELGKMYRLQMNNERAESHFRSAADVASRTESHEAKAVALHGLGMIYHERSSYEQAEQAFREAHEIHSRIGDDRGAANALDSLGDIYRARSEYQQAEQAYREAHTIHSRIGNDLGAANALSGLARIYRARYECQKAEQASREAHEIHSRIGNDQGAANALNVLGEIYCFRSEYQQAEQAFREAQTIHSRIGNDLGAANALSGLARIYRICSEYQKTEQSSTEAREIHPQIGNDQGAANALDARGKIYCFRSEYQRSEQALREARTIPSRICNDLGAANAL